MKRQNSNTHFSIDTPLARVGLREQVSHRILTAIFETQFKSGERLVVERLAKLFGVSPTPVRESLVELAGLGIVALLPNRGAVVKPFGPTQLRDLSQIRRILEVEAVLCAAKNLPIAGLDDLRTELRQVDKLPRNARRDQRARLADTRLHTLIAEHCGNPRLAAEIERCLVLFRALRNVSHLRDSETAYRRSNDIPEHLKIVQALLAGEGDRAAKAMDQHIRSVQHTLTAVIFDEALAASQ